MFFGVAVRRAVAALLALSPLGGCVGADAENVPPFKEPTGRTHSAPTAVPCCGCLCADPTWSCSDDTCTDETGRVMELAAEAGFLEVPLIVQPGFEPLLPAFIGASARSEEGTTASARMFYAFHPADEDAEQKPLFVFMQGGPGSSVLPLWGGNTGPLTLDPRVANGAAPNPHSWTRFANLLYIDTPWAGFSYQRPVADGAASPPGVCTRPFDPEEEAAAYVRTLLRFLARHPALSAAPVALVAESYGGARATLILQQLMYPERLRDSDQLYLDPSLADEIEMHLTMTAARHERSFSAATLAARQFFAQVLIQPAVLGDLQPIGVPAPGDCTWPEGKSQAELESELVAAMQLQLGSAARLSTFLGVDARSLRWFYASERGETCRREAVPQEPLELAEFGELPEHDLFYVRRAELHHAGNEALPPPLPGVEDLELTEPSNRRRSWLGDAPQAPIAELFVDNLRRVATFMTNAGCDGIVSSEGVWSLLSSVAGVSMVQLASEQGEVTVELADGLRRTARFPSYPESGHIVTLHAPEAIARDVEAFIAGALEARE